MIDFILGGIIIVLCIAISILVMLQKSKDKQLSGAIAGGMDNFLGGSKGDKKDKLYSTLTAILSVVFGIVAIVMYVVIG